MYDFNCFETIYLPGNYLQSIIQINTVSENSFIQNN